MTHVLAEDDFEVSAAEDEEMVQAVFSDGAYEALGERVRPWGADRGLDRRDADRGQNGAERRSELRIPVAHEKAETASGFFEVAGEGRATWVTQRLSGLVVTPRRWTTRRLTSITKKT